VIAFMPNLFNHNLIRTHIQNHQIEAFDEKLRVIQGWKKSIQTNKGVNEKALQSAFLQGIFNKILGYNTFGEAEEWHLSIEVSTEVDATTPDCILGFYTADESITQAVIELKSPRISLDKKQSRAGKDYGTPVEQAFSYASKYDRCSWVIVSNMNEIRLYKVGRSQEYYESFFVDDLDNIDEFKKFHLLLCKENLIRKEGQSPTFSLSEKTKEHIQDISVSFYNLYKNIRIQLFEELKASNPEVEKTILVEKAQKFLDRIIFICFCEDLGLLPNNLLHHAIQRGKDSFSDSEYVIWQEIRGVFRAIDAGSTKHNIPAYNGGLFALDEMLDDLSIKNSFFGAIYEISAYDFGTDLDVNILGHIFEQSISDIEELKADVENEDYDPQKSRRKKDGIYYTPSYITKYIVENSLGKYLEDIRKSLGEDDLPDIEAATTAQLEGRYKKKLLQFYQDYEARLKSVKVLDPACGSGAFLNQAFDFLLEEYRWIHGKLAELEEGQTSIFDSDAYQRSVLQDNLFGVDLNEESVEITKLSLWLKTADSRNALPYLDNNIKCGNSLIDDPEVAGDKAFKWGKEFPEIMADGGFDVVIGNPPYVRAHNLPLEQKKYFMNKYVSATGQYDLYVLFYEISIKLLANKGYFGFITSNKFMVANYGIGLREYLHDNVKYLQIVDVSSDDVFKGVSVYPFIVILQKCLDSVERLNNVICYYSSLNAVISHENNITAIPQNGINKDTFIIDLNITKGNKSIFEKLEGKGNTKIKKISELFCITRGFRPPPQDLIPSIEQIRTNPSVYHKYLTGKDVGVSYLIKWAGNYVLYEETLIYESKPVEVFQKPKVVFRDIGLRLNAAYDGNGYLCLKTIYFLYHKNGGRKTPLKYTLAILNSKLMHFYFVNKFEIMHIQGGYLRFRKQFVEQLPIAITSVANEDKFIGVVSNIIDYKQRLWQLTHNANFGNLKEKYTSQTGGSTILNISRLNDFYNPVYTGRAGNINSLLLTINDTILTIYNNAGTKSIEIVKFDARDHYQRQYLKLYLENLTEEQLAEINQYSGNILDKVLQINIPDYDKPVVVRKVVNEWNQLQAEIADLEKKIEATDKEIDQMVYELYGLTEEEIKIVEQETS
jgi:type I restriction-modification system DNA methylase subunit